jgi:competence protein ComEC
MLRTKNIIIFLSFLSFILWGVVFDLAREKDYSVSFFDVGQGDSAFIEVDDYQILIDGGPGIAVLEKLGEEMPFWDRTIDLIVLTHPEYDHMSGLLEVLENYRVENILWTGILKDTAEFVRWQSLVEKEEAKIIIGKAGDRVILGDEEYLEILFPFESLEGKEIKDANDTSVVSKLVLGEISFLFTGDISKSIENKIIKSGADTDVDVLKISHHGSKTSSSAGFVESVSPEYAVISCGKDNSYGHPHGETLEVLEKYGINIFRTDLQGDIKLTMKNNKIYGVPDF